MRMKLLFGLIVVFLLSIPLKAQTCYVTKTGTKYHLPSCSYLKYSKTPYDLDKAVAAGYTACSRCKPTKKSLALAAKTVKVTPNKVTKTVSSVRCKGRTKSGTRCKRQTKNASGYCYQHG